MLVHTAIRNYDGPCSVEVIQASTHYVLTWLKFYHKYKQGSHKWPLAPLQCSYQVFKKYLRNYPDIAFKNQFLDKVKNGWRTGFVGNRNNLVKHGKNFVNSVEEYLIAIRKFTKELEEGIVFPKPDLLKLEYVFSIFMVPKKPGPNGEKLFRLIANGSVSDPYLDSVNSGIPDETAYVNLAQLEDYCRLFENCNYMCCEDLTKSFRQQHIHKNDIALNAYNLLGLEIVDGRSPMGVRSSPANMQELANMIIWVAINVVLTDDERLWTALFVLMLAYIDDYTCAHSTKNGCDTLCKAIHKVVNSLGLSFNKDKAIHLKTKGDAHGFHWHLPLQRFRLSDKRYEKLIQFLQFTQQYDFITIRAAFALSGAIISYSSIIPEAKSCVYSLIRLIYRYFDAKRKDRSLQLKKILFINKQVKAHFRIWLIFAQHFIWCSIARILYRPSNVITISSDACDFGLGFFSEDLNIYSMVKLEGVHRYLHINHKEMYAVIVLVHSLIPLIAGKNVKLLVDNTSVVCSIAHRWSKSFILMIMIFELCFLATKHQFTFYIDWIATKDNHFADALSRLDFHRFTSLCKMYDVSFDNLNQVHVIEPDRFVFFSN